MSQMSTNLVSLTTRQLVRAGYDYESVVRRIPNPDRRKYGPQRTISIDFMNFADLIAVKAGRTGMIALQVCGAGEVCEHTDRYKSDEERGRRKLKVKDRIRNFIDGTGNRFEVWGWEKVGSRWQVVILEATIGGDGIRFIGCEDPLP